MGIKDVIARCIERMRGGACATCDNRNMCPAGRWQQAFGPPRQERRNGATGGAFFAFLGELAQTLARPAPEARCFKKEVELAIEPVLGAGAVSIDRVARELGMSRQFRQHHAVVQHHNEHGPPDAQRSAVLRPV